MSNNVNDSVSTSEGGIKFDGDKVRWDLVPWDAMEEIVKVLTYGANKYADRNWEKGMEYGRLIRATIGHVTDWAMRRDVDSETGLSHLAHAGCCILFLLAYVLRNIGKDNRPLKKEITGRDVGFGQVELHIPGQWVAK
jgi:hypothetical protein